MKESRAAVGLLLMFSVLLLCGKEDYVQSTDHKIEQSVGLIEIEISPGQILVNKIFHLICEL